jgi:hypothetical protein
MGQPSQAGRQHLDRMAEHVRTGGHKWETIISLAIGVESVDDGLGSVLVQTDAEAQVSRVIVQGGTLPLGEEYQEFGSLGQAMEFAFSVAKAFAFGLAREMEGA